MIKHGPVDVLVLAAGEPRFDGSVLAELERQAAKGTIRVLDAMLLFKDDAGACWRVDIEDLAPADKAALGFIETDTRGLFDSEDAETLYEGMVSGSAVDALGLNLGFWDWILALIGGGIGALLFARFFDWGLILFASLIGSMLVIRAAMAFLPSLTGTLGTILILALTALGVYYHYRRLAPKPTTPG